MVRWGSVRIVDKMDGAPRELASGTAVSAMALQGLQHSNTRFALALFTRYARIELRQWARCFLARSKFKEGYAR